MKMKPNRVNVGIVGLGRWAKVLARAGCASDRLAITTAYSRSQEKRSAFAQEFGVASAPDLPSLLADPRIEGVIITTPNEQHLPVAREAARAGKHIYTEKPIASTLEEGLEIEALEKTLGTSTFPVDLWIDGHGVARRLQFRGLPRFAAGQEWFPPQPARPRRRSRSPYSHASRDGPSRRSSAA